MAVLFEVSSIFSPEERMSVDDTDLVSLVLHEPSSAVYAEIDGKPLLLAANYHGAHSEGAYKTIVQDVINRRGPWVRYSPPGANEGTFYLQDFTLPHALPPKFHEHAQNLRKMDHSYLFTGDPSTVFDLFRERGFEFRDSPMPVERYLRLYALERK